MSRAFDTANHALPITKLEYIGISGPALEWLRSYLSHRNQIVEIRGVRSRNAR